VLDGRQPRRVVPHWTLGRHPDTAVQLDGLLADVPAGPPDLQFGPRRDHPVEVAVGDRPGDLHAHAGRSSSETYISTARCVSVWNFSG